MVVDLAVLDREALEQLVHFLISHLLAKLGEDITKFTGTDEPVSSLVKDLESFDKLVGSTGGLPSIRPVQHRQKLVIAESGSDSLLELCDLCLGRILTQGPQEFTKGFTGHLAGASFVKEGKGFSVFCVVAGHV